MLVANNYHGPLTAALFFSSPRGTPTGGQLIVVATNADAKATRSVKFVDLATGEVARTLPPLDEEFRGNAALAVTKDGRLLAASLESKSADEPQQLKLWDVSAKSKARVLFEVPRGKYGQIDFSPDGRLLALAVGDTVKLWDAATGQEARALDVPNRLAKLYPDMANV